MAELSFNEQLTKEIRTLNFEVFLPQEHKFDVSTFKSVSEKNKAIFEMDRKEMLSSDVFLFVLDGRIPDEGACVALGIVQAYKALENKKMKIVGLHTDRRVAFNDSALNPMIESSLDEVFLSVEDLKEYLKTIN